MTIYLLPVYLGKNQRIDMKAVKLLAGKLKSKEVKRVIGCEVLSPAVRVVAAELKSAPSIDPRLKPFNLGRSSRKKPEIAQFALEMMLNKCQQKNDWSIPISGGDSWKSYLKRMWASVVEGLVNHGMDDVALVLDPRNVQMVKEMVSHKSSEIEPKAALFPQVDCTKVYLVRTNGGK